MSSRLSLSNNTLSSHLRNLAKNLLSNKCSHHPSNQLKNDIHQGPSSEKLRPHKVFLLYRIPTNLAMQISKPENLYCTSTPQNTPNQRRSQLTLFWLQSHNRAPWSKQTLPSQTYHEMNPSLSRNSQSKNLPISLYNNQEKSHTQSFLQASKQ